jgi:outer membrane protein assembly factor BamB
VGTFTNPSIFKLNASTGAIECSLVAPQPLEGTPIVVTPPGGNSTLYISGEDSVTKSGPLMAIDTSNCKLDWEFTGYPEIAGSWVAASYALDATGQPLILFGTADPDSAEYALNALTGAEVWRYAVYNPSPSVYDIGAGAVLSSPGTNGFADGVVYVPSKYGIMYALDLTTGSLIWSVNFNVIAGTTEGGRSTAALVGTNLVFGYSAGMFDLNASTGAVLWQYKDPSGTEIISSPAVAGPSGSQIVVAADLAGSLDVVSLRTGAPLYHYQTGGYVTASPAISDGHILLASSDGFLYEFARGGGNSVTLPTTNITSPSVGSTLSHPTKNLVLAGNASDALGVAQVEVAIRSGGANGPWWDGPAKSWTRGPFMNSATLSTKGATYLTWKTSFPVPSGGGNYQVTAYAISLTGQSDIHGAQVDFAVLSATSGPHITASPANLPPGAKVTVTGGGFAPLEVVLIQGPAALSAQVHATPSGSLPATALTVPGNSTFGQASLSATGKTSGSSATVAITIENSWLEQGHNQSRAGYEANDPTFFNLVHPGGNIWIDLAWHFDAGVSINTSPAIANDVAYVGDESGNLYALDIRNGGLLWTWTDPSGAAITGSPAVDPTLGLVFVGTQDGTIFGIALTTGTTMWSTALGGQVMSPACGNGVLYLSTSAGTVAALSESTGAVIWSVGLASSTRAAPSLDAVAGLVVIGESDGDVVALNAPSGSIAWTFAAGGAVVAAAAISGGTVFVGSTDDQVYALQESDGNKIWNYTTGGSVNDAGSVSPEINSKGFLLAIGSNDGNLYILNAGTGSLQTSVSFGSEIVGVATSKGTAVIETSSGMIGGARTYTNLIVWRYRTGVTMNTSPALSDGTIYVGAGDGNLYAFTSYGEPPD